jgi:glyoxylate/hydroxypyruvate reductase A
MKLDIALCVRESAAREWLDALADALAARGLDANLWWRDAAKAEVQDAAEPAEIAVVWRPPNAFFVEQPRLKTVFNLGAGVDALLGLPDFPRNVSLVRLEDAGMAPALAEYVLTAVLRVYRGFDRYATQQTARHWKPEKLRERSTFAIGVLGLGVIGSAIATMLAQHGFTVRGHAQTRKQIAAVDCSAGMESFGPFLDGLDVLVNVLPLTAASRGLIDRSVLGRLARGAHLINVGRGATLVDADLIAALADGQLSGATLDVFATEPLPAEHPFWARPEILITPHVSAETQIAPTVVQVADKLAQLARGEQVSGVVDLARGY